LASKLPPDDPGSAGLLSACPRTHRDPRWLADRIGRFKRDRSGWTTRFHERWRWNYQQQNGKEYGPPFHRTRNATLICFPSAEFDKWFIAYTSKSREGLAPGLAKWQAEQKALKDAKKSKKKKSKKQPLKDEPDEPTDPTS
jgi:hypothetical protein